MRRLNTHPSCRAVRGLLPQGSFPQSDVTLFDFPLRKKFRDIGIYGNRIDLRSLNEGTLMAEQPALAVTFVDNHDKQFGRDFQSHVENWFKPLAYAYILLRQPGFPCLFFPDYYGSQDKSYGEQRHTGQPNGIAYLQLHESSSILDTIDSVRIHLDWTTLESHCSKFRSIIFDP